MDLTIPKIETENGFLMNLDSKTLDYDFKHIYAGNILSGKEIENHYHKERTEKFICLKGIITVILGNSEGKEEDAFDLESGDYVDIPVGKLHTLLNLTEEPVLFIGFSDKEPNDEDVYYGVDKN